MNGVIKKERVLASKILWTFALGLWCGTEGWFMKAPASIPHHPLKNVLSTAHSSTLSKAHRGRTTRLRFGMSRSQLRREEELSRTTLRTPEKDSPSSSSAMNVVSFGKSIPYSNNSKPLWSNTFVQIYSLPQNALPPRRVEVNSGKSIPHFTLWEPPLMINEAK